MSANNGLTATYSGWWLSLGTGTVHVKDRANVTMMTVSDSEAARRICTYRGLEAENAKLRERIAAIADDFHPDRKEDAPLALQEMRDALSAALEGAA